MAMAKADICAWLPPPAWLRPRPLPRSKILEHSPSLVQQLARTYIFGLVDNFVTRYFVDSI